MAAVRVPPSASSTSQSRVIGALAERLEVGDGAQRAADEPLDLERAPAAHVLARGMRSAEERGSMAYSAVTQPWPLPRRKPGTRSSTVAAQSTRVRPISTRAEPSAWCTAPR